MPPKEMAGYLRNALITLAFAKGCRNMITPILGAASILRRFRDVDSRQEPPRGAGNRRVIHQAINAAAGMQGAGTDNKATLGPDIDARANLARGVAEAGSPPEIIVNPVRSLDC